MSSDVEEKIMAAGFFAVIGMFMLLGLPALMAYWATAIGPVAAITIACSSIGASILIFALATVIDRLDQVVAALKSSKTEA